MTPWLTLICLLNTCSFADDHKRSLHKRRILKLPRKDLHYIDYKEMAFMMSMKALSYIVQWQKRFLSSKKPCNWHCMFEACGEVRGGGAPAPAGPAPASQGAGEDQQQRPARHNIKHQTSSSTLVFIWFLFTIVIRSESARFDVGCSHLRAGAHVRHTERQRGQTDRRDSEVRRAEQ